MRLGRQYGCVETLEVPDLQDALEARGERNQLARLRRRIGDRLLHQHVRTGFEEVTRDGKVRRSRCGDAHRLDAAEERPVVAHGACFELGGELLTRLGPRIRDRDELAAGRLRVFLCVKAAQVAHADDRGSDFLHEKAIMPARAATPSNECTHRPRPKERHPWTAWRTCAIPTAHCRERSASWSFSAWRCCAGSS